MDKKISWTAWRCKNSCRIYKWILMIFTLAINTHISYKSISKLRCKIFRNIIKLTFFRIKGIATRLSSLVIIWRSKRYERISKILYFSELCWYPVKLQRNNKKVLKDISRMSLNDVLYFMTSFLHWKVLYIFMKEKFL